MMYNHKLAIAVKSNGKVLREQKDQVFVPFGTEYTLLIKNLDSVRAQVRVQIDGVDATEGVSLVIPANGEVELERFIKNGNRESGNRFKFIERTAGVENHRGIGVTDGLIRIEYQFEKRAPKIEHVYHHYDYWPLRSRPYPWDGEVWYGSTSLQNCAAPTKAFSSNEVSCSDKSNILRSMSFNSTSASLSAGSNATMDSYQQKMASAEVANDIGVTVEGSVSEQKFNHAAYFAVESETHTMIVKLLGETASGKQVVKPVTVKQKPKCKTCGHSNKANAKFCSQCGTSLQIV